MITVDFLETIDRLNLDIIKNIITYCERELTDIVYSSPFVASTFSKSQSLAGVTQGSSIWLPNSASYKTCWIFKRATAFCFEFNLFKVGAQLRRNNSSGSVLLHCWHGFSSSVELVRNFFGDGCEVSSSSSSNFDSVYDDNVRSGSESSASRFDELEKGKIPFLNQLSQGPGSKTIVIE